MFSSTRAASSAAPFSQPHYAITQDVAETPIASAKALKSKLEALGYSFQAMYFFCSLDLAFLQELQEQEPLEGILSNFQDYFEYSCVMEHLSKVFAHMGNFDRSYAVICKITMASQAQSSCYFLTSKMITSGLIKKAFENIDSLYNLGSMQQIILENSALDQVLAYMKSNPSHLLSSIEFLALHFQQRRTRAHHDTFWENAYKLCITYKHTVHAQVCLRMIFSLRTKDSLLKEKKIN